MKKFLCAHVWAYGREKARELYAVKPDDEDVIHDACQVCPATCERGEDGEIVAFDAEPEATAVAEAKSAERKKAEREAKRGEPPVEGGAS